MSKAIVEVPGAGAYFEQAMQIARHFEAGEAVPEADYHLGFPNTEALFETLTPARLALLDVIKGLGPVTVAVLSARLGRDAAADVTQLLELELVEQDAEGQVWVPWEEVQIRVAVAKAA
jgi:predicted transcriptional regulator